VGGSDKSWLICCVVDYPASSIRFDVFYKVVRQHYSGEVSEFILLWCEIASGFCTPKSYRNRFIFCRVIQNI